MFQLHCRFFIGYLVYYNFLILKNQFKPDEVAQIFISRTWEVEAVVEGHPELCM